MRVVSLGSGSSGNALLIEAGPQGRTKVLVDAGLSTRLLTSRLSSVGVRPAQLKAVLVTHEHSDHVQALPTLMRRFSVPVFTHAHTHTAILDGLKSGYWRSDSGRSVSTQLVQSSLQIDSTVTATQVAVELDTDLTATPFSALQELQVVLPFGRRCKIGDIEVTSFPISHDAVAPAGYLLQAGGCRVCVVTDSGEVTSTMLEYIQHADLLVLESNHDRVRLLRGPYPYHLKQRILGDTGHLSNEQTAQAILHTWRADAVRWIWLAHLSRTNNTPTLAVESLRAYLQAANANLAQVHISALPPGVGGIWDSTQLWHAPTLWQMPS